MEIKVSQNGAMARMDLVGSIDQVGSEELKNAIGGMNLSGVREVEIDFAGVKYIGSAGVGKLLLLYKNIPAKDAKVRLVRVPKEFFDLFQDMELDEIFDISLGS